MRINLSENVEFSRTNKFIFILGRICVGVLFILNLSACNSTKEGSLIGDYDINSNCPASGCADLSPKSESVYLLRDDTKTINLATSLDSLIEISGTCSASTYPNNRIEVTNTLTGAVISPLAINLGTTSTIPKCAMGKFNIYLNGCAFPAVGNVRLNLSLKPLDSAGQPIANTNADILVNIYRSAAASSACR